MNTAFSEYYKPELVDITSNLFLPVIQPLSNFHTCTIRFLQQNCVLMNCTALITEHIMLLQKPLEKQDGSETVWCACGEGLCARLPGSQM